MVFRRLQDLRQRKSSSTEFFVVRNYLLTLNFSMKLDKVPSIANLFAHAFLAGCFEALNLNNCIETMAIVKTLIVKATIFSLILLRSCLSIQLSFHKHWLKLTGNIKRRKLCRKLTLAFYSTWWMIDNSKSEREAKIVWRVVKSGTTIEYFESLASSQHHWQLTKSKQEDTVAKTAKAFQASAYSKARSNFLCFWDDL